MFPFDLKCHFFLIPIAFVLDSKFGLDGDIDAFIRTYISKRSSFSMASARRRSLATQSASGQPFSHASFFLDPMTSILDYRVIAGARCSTSLVFILAGNSSLLSMMQGSLAPSGVSHDRGHHCSLGGRATETGAQGHRGVPVKIQVVSYRLRLIDNFSFTCCMNARASFAD
ncbi:hypothetical protein [Halomonas salinarum]|uniref:hypothetical protein n=1 Tax=Halomonas salinarum TaxID=1158993 RepID=UPI001ADE38DA|nr:hypothetical protein [Halomonas salinarum]